MLVHGVCVRGASQGEFWECWPWGQAPSPPPQPAPGRRPLLSFHTHPSQTSQPFAVMKPAASLSPSPVLCPLGAGAHRPLGV